MTRHEFEEQMKDKLQEQQFAPREDLWLKLQAELQQNNAAPRKVWLFAPMKMAASAAVLLSLGLATFYVVKEYNHETIGPSVVKQQSTEPSKSNIIPSTIPTQQPVSITQNQVNNSIRVAVKNNHNIKQQFSEGREGESHVVLPLEKPPEVVQPNNTSNTAKNDAVKNGNGQRKEQDPTAFGKDLYYAGNNLNKTDKAIHLGMTANVGSSTISNVGYQVGVVGQGNLNQTFFVEAGLTVASNTVNTSNDYTFPGVSISNDGFVNSSEKTSTDIKADYTRNVISVGFTPAIGIKATKQLSFSTGGSVYRNLNPSLSLDNKSEIDPNALSNNIINRTQNVANWDLGLNCNASYKVTKSLSLNVNYRKGLTDYLQQDNKYIKNSGVQFGLKFLFR